MIDNQTIGITLIIIGFMMSLLHKIFASKIRKAQKKMHIHLTRRKNLEMGYLVICVGSIILGFLMVWLEIFQRPFPKL